MELITRLYKCKDAEMLLTALLIVENAVSRQTELLVHRPGWVDPFFANLKTRVETAFSEHLGLDPRKDLRGATIALRATQQPALEKLALFKAQVITDFKHNKPRRDEILKQLGLTSHLTAAQKKDQQALVNLLYQFKKNLSPDLQAEITGKGMANDLPTSLTGFADALRGANVTQKSFKGTSGDSQAAVVEFNAIYEEVIGICKISTKILQKVPGAQSQFSFSGLLQKLSPTVTGTPSSTLTIVSDKAA